MDWLARNQNNTKLTAIWRKSIDWLARNQNNTKLTAIWRKIIDWLARNQNNVSKWSDVLPKNCCFMISDPVL